MKLIVCHGTVRRAQGGHILPPESLLAERVHVNKGGSVGEIRKTPRANNSVELVLSLLQNVRIERHGKKYRLDGGKDLGKLPYRI